jgi:hypothetical protein
LDHGDIFLDLGVEEDEILGATALPALIILTILTTAAAKATATDVTSTNITINYHRYHCHCIIIILPVSVYVCSSLHASKLQRT